MKNRPKVKLGATFIASVDDGSSCVGVVTKYVNRGVRHDDDEGPTDVNALILGWFPKSSVPPNEDVFGKQKMHPFPSYEELQISKLLPYSFELEINLCKLRNDVWWSENGYGGSIKDSLQLFQPIHRQALMYVDAAIHLLTGKSIENYHNWNRFHDRDFLTLWSVLYLRLPKMVACPPTEWGREKSNVYHLVDLKARMGPLVTTGFRAIR